MMREEVRGACQFLPMSFCNRCEPQSPSLSVAECSVFTQNRYAAMQILLRQALLSLHCCSVRPGKTGRTFSVDQDIRHRTPNYCPSYSNIFPPSCQYHTRPGRSLLSIFRQFFDSKWKYSKFKRFQIAFFLYSFMQLFFSANSFYETNRLIEYNSAAKVNFSLR